MARSPAPVSKPQRAPRRTLRLGVKDILWGPARRAVDAAARRLFPDSVLQTILKNVVAENEKNSSARTPNRRLHVPWVSIFPASGRQRRCAEDRHRARDRRASAARTRAMITREHRQNTGYRLADRSLGVHPRLMGWTSCVPKDPAENMSLEDVRPRRRREGREAVRARVDRRRGWQALPARYRRCRHRRQRRLRDVPPRSDRAVGRHAQR